MSSDHLDIDQIRLDADSMSWHRLHETLLAALDELDAHRAARRTPIIDAPPEPPLPWHCAFSNPLDHCTIDNQKHGHRHDCGPRPTEGRTAP